MLPLLDEKASFRKFSGSREAGKDNDRLAKAINAFAHHVVVESNGDYLLSDLQGQWLQGSHQTTH